MGLLFFWGGGVGWGEFRPSFPGNFVETYEIRERPQKGSVVQFDITPT